MGSNDKETVPNVVKEQNLAKALAGLKDGTYAHVRQASKSTGTPRSTLIEEPARVEKSTRVANNCLRMKNAPLFNGLSNSHALAIQCVIHSFVN